MSLFNKSNATSLAYDDGRRASGSDVIAGLVQVSCGKTLQELHVLDAGCGTGNYSKDLLKMGVGHVTMFDASEGMLSKAREKIEPYKDRLTIKQGILHDLPFHDGTFDVVMFNFVLHHLVNEEADCPFQQMTLTLKEARRVLASGGVLVFGTALPEVMHEALWYAHLKNSITERYCKNNENSCVILEYTQPEVAYSMEAFTLHGDLEGPLKPKWRDSISYWAVVTDDEIREVEEKVTQLKKDGQLEEYFKEHDKTDCYGGITFLFAVKQ